MDSEKLNPNPIIVAKKSYTRDDVAGVDDSPTAAEEIDPLEVFELIRDIRDPEHPNSLEDLNVVCLEDVSVDPAGRSVHVIFTPTIPTCSMSTLIGISIRVQLMRLLPTAWKIRITVKPGSHDQEGSLNKQLNDKERVCAALENSVLLSVIEACLYPPLEASASPAA